MGLEPGTKLLIFGRGGEGGPLTLMTAEMVTEFVRHAMERLSELEVMLKEAPGAEEK
jgi:hypothetical protein